MKITKKLRKSKGFTLVELLIVIIIIGILAGMMMLATGAATDKAEATKIVSNMRNVKAAAIMAYADGTPWADMTNVAAAITKVNGYLDQPLVSGDYEIVLANSSDFFVEYQYPTGLAQGVKDKLEADFDAVTTGGSGVRMPIN